MEETHSKQDAVNVLDLPSTIKREQRIAVFSRELKTLSLLNHICVIPIYGFSHAADGYTRALVMKDMANGSLLDILNLVKEGKLLDFWTATGVAIIVCGIVVGIEFVHLKGIVYRDLKPANIFIDRGGRSRIGDLGSSKFIEGAIYL
jgi:serine/threonine protein kinase